MRPLPFTLTLSKSGRSYTRLAASLAIAHRLALFARRAGYTVAVAAV